MDVYTITDIAAGVAVGNLLAAAVIWAAAYEGKTGKTGFLFWGAILLPAVFVLTSLL